MTAPLDLGALHARYHHLLVRRARSILKNLEDAEDAASTVWVKLARGSTWSGSCAIGTWLYFMVTSEALNLKRAAKPMADRRTPITAALGLESPDPSALARLAGRDAFAAVAAKLPGLTSAEFEVLARTVRGQSRSEVATSLGIPLSTVKTRLTRARRRLR